MTQLDVHPVKCSGEYSCVEKLVLLSKRSPCCVTSLTRVHLRERAGWTGRDITADVAVNRVILHDGTVFADRAAQSKTMSFVAVLYCVVRSSCFFLTSPFFTMIRALDAFRIHHNGRKRSALS